jgi:cellulose synthase/poly-beta-1,6-N-acetylglucosamine synthase-like glycosyltransferase
MVVVFWISVFGIVYSYIGYPLLLWVLGNLVRRPEPPIGLDLTPSISMIIPVHNEALRVQRKIDNTLSLRYPRDRLEVLFISDGSTDRTVEILQASAMAPRSIVELPVRGGKAAALNAGLALAKHDVLVFSDASIVLEPESLLRIVQPFRDQRIGCVSGEDRIAESGGEGLYGRYELFLRRLESRVHSIVGASGSFYAQRRSISAPFTEGMAPDFLSVLRTVEQGYRAVSEPTAVGAMTSVSDPKHEFERKVRTSVRGMTTLFAHAHVLNPFRYGLFSFALFSHKVTRWAVPFFLVSALLSAMWLLDSPIYLAAFLAQVAVYVGALLALARWGGVDKSLPGRIALYFSSVNAAILAAWFQYGRGVRQEIWTPSRR